jgi:hypothetical protein
MEHLKNIINCKFCSFLLNDPVLLPCGETICRKHETQFKASKCNFCNQTHKLNLLEHFPSNKIAQNFLEVAGVDFSQGYSSLRNNVIEIISFLNTDSQIKSPKFDMKNFTSYGADLFHGTKHCCENAALKLNSYEKEFQANITILKDLSDETLLGIRQRLSVWLLITKMLFLDETLWDSIDRKCQANLATITNDLKKLVDEVAYLEAEKLESNCYNVFHGFCLELGCNQYTFSK